MAGWGSPHCTAGRAQGSARGFSSIESSMGQDSSQSNERQAAAPHASQAGRQYTRLRLTRTCLRGPDSCCCQHNRPLLNTTASPVNAPWGPTTMATAPAPAQGWGCPACPGPASRDPGRPPRPPHLSRLARRRAAAAAFFFSSVSLCFCASSSCFLAAPRGQQSAGTARHWQVAQQRHTPLPVVSPAAYSKLSLQPTANTAYTSSEEAKLATEPSPAGPFPLGAPQEIPAE